LLISFLRLSPLHKIDILLPSGFGNVLLQASVAPSVKLATIMFAIFFLKLLVLRMFALCSSLDCQVTITLARDDNYLSDVRG